MRVSGSTTGDAHSDHEEYCDDAIDVVDMSEIPDTGRDRRPEPGRDRDWYTARDPSLARGDKPEDDDTSEIPDTGRERRPRVPLAEGGWYSNRYPDIFPLVFLRGDVLSTSTPPLLRVLQGAPVYTGFATKKAA